jgi:ABC-type glutathione transport system ATPase component
MSLLRAERLTFRYPGRRQPAVDDVSFEIAPGGTLGIVGETGSGKSTLTRIVLGLLRPDEGTLRYDGLSVFDRDPRVAASLRRRVQVIFQDPASSLDPRWTVEQSLSEVHRIHRDLGKATRAGLASALERVGLTAEYLARRPRQMSGGECQRVVIARALLVRTQLLVCDEPVSSLDVLVRAQILNLLTDLQRRDGTACLFVTHDLRVARHMSDDILVMKEGRVCEQGSASRVFDAPKHPYTKALLAASLA